MRIHGAKHGDVEDKLLEWFCCTWANSIPVEGHTVKGEANEIMLKME